MEREKEIDLEGIKYTLKRWTTEEKGAINDAMILDGERKIPSLKTVIATLKGGVKNMTEDEIKKLDSGVSEVLFIQCWKFNTLPFEIVEKYVKPIVEERRKDTTQSS